ncbi:MAG: PAS domain S-box protein [Deltaproteobacteria bacterium]|nr:PAS domain S-box protein [Deltaproteobacteria bacterium]
MLSENIILQSAGSLSVAVLALLMLISQALFFFKKPQFTWCAWSAAGSFSALLYSIGIFFEYNTPEGPLNRFSGLLEWTAVICLIHCLYGFTFSYFGIESKRYHPLAGVCHGIILILLWFTHYIVADSFTTRNFIFLGSPYIEPALGPLGPLFMLYTAAAAVNAMVIWIKYKRTDPKLRAIFVAGMGFWILLGIHDGLAALGLPALQYFMEYGFLGFTLAVLWVVFNKYLEIAAEEKYRVITECANDCIMVIQDEKMVFGNPACNDLIGGLLTDSATGNFLDILAPEDRKTGQKNYNTLLEGLSEPNPHTVRIRGEDGEQRFVEIESSLIQYRNRPAFLAIIRDMTERNRAEEVLRESEEKYSSMMEAMSDSVYICSPDFRIVYMNPSMIKMIGYDATGERCHKALHEEDEQCPWCLHDKVQQGESSEIEIVSPKNNRSYHVTNSPIFHEDGSVAKMTIYKDITSTKQLQHQLIRSERLSATGQLAATVAHEINSPLQGITSLLNLIERTHGQDESLLKKLNLVQKGFLSIRDTVKQLLDLNRPGKNDKQPMNINRVIEDTVGLLGSYLKKNHVEIILDLSTTIPNITASPQQLGQVFINLISNAVEAIAGTSKSKNDCNTQKAIHGKITVNSHVGKNKLIIRVIDTGPGISEDDMVHIFDPFFTRKKEMGMGIGLSFCYGIIKDHNGSIGAENSPEGGAVFTITLPIKPDNGKRYSYEEKDPGNR